MKPSRHSLNGLALAALVLAADWASKSWMLANFGPEPRHLETILPFFNLVMVWNPGISFGMFAGHDWGRWLVTAGTAAITLVLIVWLWRRPKAAVALALGCIIGGAIGNIIDRLRYGAVVDFLDFHWQGWHWPAFNIADSAIFVGVAVLVIDGLLEGKTPAKSINNDAA